MQASVFCYPLSRRRGRLFFGNGTENETTFFYASTRTPDTGMGTVINSYGMDRCAAAAAIKLAENKMVKIKTNAKGYKTGPGSPRKPSL